MRGKNYFAFFFGVSGTLALLDGYNCKFRVNIDVDDPKKEPVREWKVAYNRIGKPGALYHRQPDSITYTYSPYYPRNGAIIMAREDLDFPDWLQLTNGKWVVKEQCDVQLCVPVERDADGNAVEKGEETDPSTPSPLPAHRYNYPKMKRTIS